MLVHSQKNILLKKVENFFILLGVFFLPFIVFAQGDPSDTGCDSGNSICNPLKETTLIGFLDSVVGVLIQFAIPIAAIAIIYAGFLFVTAQGSETQISKAKKTFYWTIIGVTVLLGASVIISVIAETIRTL